MTQTLPHPGEHRDPSGLRRWIKWFVLLGGVVVLVVVVLRVSREDAGDPLPPSHEPPTGSNGDQTYSDEQMAEFAECMREQGIDFRDEVGADGQVEMRPGPGVDTTGSAFQEATSTCAAEAGGAPPGGGHG